MSVDKNADLLRRADRAFAGASLGSFFLPDEHDFVVSRGKGSRVYDVEGKEYIDYVLGSGPMILGHAHPAVMAAVQEQLSRGTSYYAVNQPAILLAETIIEASPCAEAVKFCGSGAEATFYALRIARAATGREKVLKFEGGYHGHHDYAMLSTTPTTFPPFPTPVPDSAGIPRSVQAEVLIAPFNDLDATVRIMEAHRTELAAVIVEAQSRLIEPTPGFLQGLRDATRRLGVVLIFDEVVTGFRLAWGGAQEFYGVTADLATYGKIIGGGFPLAAVAGRRDLMDLTNPRQKAPNYVYVSGTLNGNAVSATAGLATLAELRKPGAYATLQSHGERMRTGLQEVAAKLDVPAQVLGRGPLANIYFTSEPLTDYRSSAKVDRKLAQLVNRQLLTRGFMCLTGKLYISLAHSAEDVDKTVQAFYDSLQALRG